MTCDADRFADKSLWLIQRPISITTVPIQEPRPPKINPELSCPLIYDSIWSTRCHGRAKACHRGQSQSELYDLYFLTL
jgi:hypothetical protein